MTVLLDKDGPIATITLNRPDRLNAFGASMRQDIRDTIRDVMADPGIRVVLVTGAGRAFCAGADISYMQDLVERADWASARDLVQLGAEVVSAIADAPKPVIAVVNGAAAGGGANLALACDIRIASDRASIGQTFARIGLHPDWGGTYFLPRLVGLGKALELAFTAEMIDAGEAFRLGLFDRVVPHDRLQDESRALASQIAAQAPLAIASAKRALRASVDASLHEALAREVETQASLFTTADVKEGMDAFLQKRRAVFGGRD